MWMIFDLIMDEHGSYSYTLSTIAVTRDNIN